MVDAALRASGGLNAGTPFETTIASIVAMIAANGAGQGQGADIDEDQDSQDFFGGVRD